MEICHTQGDVFDDVEGPLVGEFLVLFVEVVEETAVWKELGYHSVLVIVDAHSHIENDWGMEESADELHLLDEVANVSIPQSFLFDVSLNELMFTLTATYCPNHFAR